MLHVKRFIDKMAVAESKQSKDLVLPMAEARGLRDEVSKLLSDLNTLLNENNKSKETEVIQVEVKGGSF